MYARLWKTLLIVTFQRLGAGKSIVQATERSSPELRTELNSLIFGNATNPQIESLVQSKFVGDLTLKKCKGFNSNPRQIKEGECVEPIHKWRFRPKIATFLITNYL